MPAVQCAVHPDVEADRQCTSCKREMCEGCATWEIDGHAACDACGQKEIATSRGITTALFACVAVGYLASRMLLPRETTTAAHLFLAATMCATSVGITARVFKDLGVLQTREATVVLGAAVIVGACSEPSSSGLG